jgi:RHS repeat-associated protein
VFGYDGLSRRVRITELVGTTTNSDKQFVWCGQEFCEERDTTGTNVTRRFFGEGEQIGGTNYFFASDHLGSIREMTDGGGTVRARYCYDPYGRRSVNQISVSPIEADFGFTGYYFHAPSGLHLALYREYSADLGRWLNRDPIAENGGINLYNYVANNPINYYDPFGLEDYNSLQTQMKLAQAYASATAGFTQGLENIRNNSQGRGPYDFGWNEHSNDTWCVNGKIMNADQFGNYIAGFQGAAYDVTYPVPVGLASVIVAGVGYHITGRTKAPNDRLDRTGRPDIDAGAAAAAGFLGSPTHSGTCHKGNGQYGCK